MLPVPQQATATECTAALHREGHRAVPLWWQHGGGFTQVVDITPGEGVWLNVLAKRQDPAATPFVFQPADPSTSTLQPMETGESLPIGTHAVVVVNYGHGMQTSRWQLFIVAGPDGQVMVRVRAPDSTSGSKPTRASSTPSR